MDKPWHDPADYPFTQVLVDGYPAIRRELEQLDKSKFQVWHQTELYKFTDAASWRVFGLVGFGEKNLEHCALCPETTRVVEQIPGLTTAGFSWFSPGTHLDPHLGFTNDVLRCHLGVIVPEGCAIRVGTDARPWREGQVMVFDDTYEHEAWNHGESDRFILLLDFLKNPRKKYHARLMKRELFRGRETPAGAF